MISSQENCPVSSKAAYGGKLEFYDNQGRKIGYKPIYSNKNKSIGNSLVVKLVIFLVFGAVAKIGSSAVMGLSETMDTIGGLWRNYSIYNFYCSCYNNLGLLWFLFRKG